MELRVASYELRIWGCEFFARLYYDGVMRGNKRLFLYAGRKWDMRTEVRGSDYCPFARSQRWLISL